MAIVYSAINHQALSQPGPSHSTKIPEPPVCDRAFIYLPGHGMAVFMSVIVQIRKEASGSLWAFHQWLPVPTSFLGPLFLPLWRKRAFAFTLHFPEHSDSLLLSSK